MLERSPLTGPSAPPREPASLPTVPINGWRPGEGLQVRLALSLPREDTAVVAVVRRIVDTALAALGVTQECRGDIALALTESCANAVSHAKVGDDYHVTVSTHADRCVIEVADTGIGLDLDRIPAEPPEPTAVSGRGLHIIRACTDEMELRAVRPHGLAIRMVKMLAWDRTHLRRNGFRIAVTDRLATDE
jgi:serine/threonine-protein kinase RsbW